MRLVCVILLISTLALLFHTTIADIDEGKELTKNPQQNDDDTSLFRGMENGIVDQDSEDDDAYRMLKTLQDVREDEDFDPDSNEDDILFDEVDDSPEFKNEDTTDFFEHVPQQLIDNNVDDTLSGIQVIDDELDELAPKADNEEEDGEEDQQVENSTPSPVLSHFSNEHSIPWRRPESAMKADGHSNFYQDINYKESEKLQQQRPASARSSFQFWHLFFIIMILVIVYNSITKRKSNNSIELPSSSSSSLPWGNKGEKDYLPLHNNTSKQNSYYKHEIKSS